MSKDSYTFATAAATVLVAIGTAYYLTRSTLDEKASNPNEEVIELLLGEEKGLIYASSTSTVTFYQGDITKSFDICQRLLEIITKNPWLASSLTNRMVRGEKHLVARYSNPFPASLLQQHFQEITISSDDSKYPNEKESWEIINQKLKRFTVKSGADCIDRPSETLFKVTVLKTQDKVSGEITYSTLIVSLSHVIGDGHTFYSIYALLDPRTPSTALPTFEAKRLMDFPERLDNIYGKEFQQYLQSASFLFCVLSTLLLSKSPDVTLLNINAHGIQTTKQQYQKQHQQLEQHVNSSLATKLSTNDIITSWYFHACDCDIGVMAVNYRNRLDGYTNKHAGNYEGMIFYAPNDYRTPLEIRQSISSNGLRSNSNPIPSFRQTMRYRFSCVTNWSSFYHHLVFSSAIHRVHLPLYDVSSSVFRDMAIVFAPREHEIAICILHRSKLSLSSLLQSAPFVSRWSNE